MASIAHALRIKYGLAVNPSEADVQTWVSRTQSYIRQGVEQEAAGRRAAYELFRDFETHFYASEADTIEMLLQQAGEK